MEAETLEKLKKAGSIAAQALEYAKTLVKPGVLLVDVCNKVEDKIKQLGGSLAFPVQISLNDTAAHFCPDAEDKTAFNEQVVKIDIGVHIDGYIGDTACTIDLSGKNAELVKASKEALDAAIRIAKPGVKLSEIGAVIHDTITKHGFSPVRNLSGHGLDVYDIHSSPSVPNYDNGDKTVLEDGQLIAIEPFATNGAGIIYESSPATIFAFVEERPVRIEMVREILKKIKSYNDLPFTTRWLTDEFSVPKVRLALTQLRNLGIIREFPPLVEQNHGLVSQAEHTIVVKETSIILTKM